jgi:hypothetical protein
VFFVLNAKGLLVLIDMDRNVGLFEDNLRLGDEDFVAIPHGEPVAGGVDVDEAAELSMMRDGIYLVTPFSFCGFLFFFSFFSGLAKSQVFDFDSPVRSHSRAEMLSSRRESVLFSSAADLLGPSAVTPKRLDDFDVEAPVIPPPSTKSINNCTIAKTVLMLPFSFWPTEDKESPSAVAKGW